MNRCKICHAYALLDASGRCGSCAKALAATKAGMHYGDCVAALQRLPAPSDGHSESKPASDQAKTKYCPVCGEPIKALGGHINRKKYCTPSCQKIAEYRRNAEAIAQAAIQAVASSGEALPQKAKNRKPGTCRFCGKEIIRPHAEGRKPSYCSLMCQNLARIERNRGEAMQEEAHG